MKPFATMTTAEKREFIANTAKCMALREFQRSHPGDAGPQAAAHVDRHWRRWVPAAIDAVAAIACAEELDGVAKTRQN